MIIDPLPGKPGRGLVSCGARFRKKRGQSDLKIVFPFRAEVSPFQPEMFCATGSRFLKLSAYQTFLILIPAKEGYSSPGPGAGFWQRRLLFKFDDVEKIHAAGAAESGFNFQVVP